MMIYSLLNVLMFMVIISTSNHNYLHVRCIIYDVSLVDIP